VSQSTVSRKVEYFFPDFGDFAAKLERFEIRRESAFGDASMRRGPRVADAPWLPHNSLNVFINVPTVTGDTILSVRSTAVGKQSTRVQRRVMLAFSEASFDVRFTDLYVLLSKPYVESGTSVDREKSLSDSYCRVFKDSACLTIERAVAILTAALLKHPIVASDPVRNSCI
jgi:hypothetical protein